MGAKPRTGAMGHRGADALRALAMKLSNVEEGTSCVKRAFRVGGKSFAFIGVKDDEYNLMLKLGPSLDEARRMAKKAPDTYAVGGTGWLTAKWAPTESAPTGVIARWLRESHGLMAG